MYCLELGYNTAFGSINKVTRFKRESKIEKNIYYDSKQEYIKKNSTIILNKQDDSRTRYIN